MDSSQDLPRPALLVAVGASALAGLVHAVAVGAHADEPTRAGLFALCALVQVGWAALALGWRRRVVVAVGAGIGLACAAAWVIARTWGLPFEGMGRGEVTGSEGAVAAALATVSALAATVAWLRPRRSPRHGSVVGRIAIVTATFILGLPLVAAGHTHDAGDAHDHTHTDAAGIFGATGEGEAPTHPVSDHQSESAAPAAVTDPLEDAGHAHAEPAPTDAATPAAPPHATGEVHSTAGGHPATASSPDGAIATTTGGHDAHAPGGSPVTSLDDPSLSPEQRATAETLIEQTTAAVSAAYPTPEAAIADGYRTIGDGRKGGYEHLVRHDYLVDGRVLDPAHIEALVLAVGPDGTKTIASAMYILETGSTMADVPDLAGGLTQWHDHQNLCWKGDRVAGTFRQGRCTPGGELRPTPPMLHVWLTPNPCGPFAGIEGHGGAKACSHGG